jgi:hypothetical protein
VVSGVPAGVAASLSANPISPTSGGRAASTLTVKAGPSTAAASYTLTINGASGTLSHTVNVSLTVLPATYTVNFTESGLVLGVQWSVSFNGQTQNSNSNYITFNAPNGVYPYLVITPTGFNASPTGGNVTVNGQNIKVSITFLPVLPPTTHDIAVTAIVASPNPASLGDLVSISVVVLNNGTVSETFAVNVTFDSTLIGTRTVTSLAAGGNQTLSFLWNTTGLGAGYYTITVAAMSVAGETDVTNNVEAAAIQVEVPTANPYYVSGNLFVILVFFVGLEFVAASVLLLFFEVFRKKKRKKPAQRFTVRLVRTEL